MTIELESLCGEHELSGAFFDAVNEPEGTWECANVVNKTVLRFTLDGRHIEAIEDPNDGYRSTLDEVRTTEIPPQNTFAPVKVTGHIKTDGEYGGTDRILQLLNAATGKVILEIGTASTDDYYPGFVALFSPENL